MSRLRAKTWVILGGVVVFALGLGAALLREVRREEAALLRSLSGVAVLAPALAASGQADLQRTDRLGLFLVPAGESQPQALALISPLIPPTAFRVGADHTLHEAPLPPGPYWLIGISDKDGELLRPSPGEVYGRSAQPIPLGRRQVQLLLSQPFQGGLFNAPFPGAGQEAPPGRSASSAPPTQAEPQAARFSISGQMTVSPALQGGLRPTERVVILLFDPALGRPVAFEILPQARLPGPFAITLPPAQRSTAKPAYHLRILTDRDQNPLRAAPGELIGRSAQPIPLGRQNHQFVLDQPYTR